jgi:hypothetical protein
MRWLGLGQSVVFCITKEIGFKIRAVTLKEINANITILDVRRWAISETWTENRRMMSLWAVQGRNLSDMRTFGSLQTRKKRYQ